MSRSSKQTHNTRLQSASIVSSGSGDVYVGGSFAPTPTIPVNGCNLPNRHPSFVGRREEIRKVMDALASRAWIVTIDGMGGIGKTTLALEVAHLCREHCPDNPHIPEFTGYIWTSARDKPDFCLGDIIREILYVLSPYETITTRLDPPEQLSLATRALAAEPRLLIIDNFETVKDEPLHRFLRDQLPNPSKVLITSRHHIQTGERVVTIGGLEEDDAVRLLHLEAARLQIPIGDQDLARLRIIAQKSYGIPLVLRWVMESVFNGKSLEWALESLENATAEDIFDYIFKRSLSILDPETRRIFRSMSLLQTWARIETIAAMNPGIAAIQERVGHLVSLSLVDDNRSLVQSDRRYQLLPFTRYLALKELANTDDGGTSTIENAMQYYLNDMQALNLGSNAARAYLEVEFPNLDNIVRSAVASGHSPMLEQCIQLAEMLGRLDDQKARILFSHLIGPIDKAGNTDLTLKLFNSIGNPYYIGPPVRPPMFFGRKELLRYIRESFEGDQPHAHVIALVGPRRIGKTSLLYQLRYQTPTKCVYVFIDLQGIGKADTAHLLYYLTVEISHAITDRGLEVTKPRLKDFVDQPYQAFDSYIEGVLRSLGATHLVLMIDEMEVLFRRGEQGQIDVMNLLAYFRSMVQRGAFGMITSGVTPLAELELSALGSPFFNIAVSKHVSFLEREAAIELIQQPMYGLLKYDTQAIEYLLKLSGGHPYLLQFLCWSIVSLCMERGKLLVDLEIVESAMPTLDELEFYFHHLMEQLDEAAQIVMLAAARIVEIDEDAFTLNRLSEMLSKYELQVSQVENLLDELVRQEILAVDNQGNYKFTMGIFQRWLVAKGPNYLLRKKEVSQK
jgi:hypothetical protein